MIVILTDPDGDAASEEFQATVAETVAPLADEPVRRARSSPMPTSATPPS